MLAELFLRVWRLTLAGASAVPLGLLAAVLLRRLDVPRRFCRVIWALVFARFTLSCRVIPVRTASLPVAAPGTALSGWAAPAPMETVPAHSLSLLNLLSLIWAAGVLFLFGRTVIQALRLRYRVSSACLEDGCFTGDCVEAPFTFGIFRPRIYLPSGLTPAQREQILLHEKAHLERKDPLNRLLVWGLVCVHWFDPLIWLAYGQFVLDTEAECDQAVMAALGDSARAGYCENLLRFGVKPGLGCSFGESSLSHRIKAILRHRSPRLPALTAAMLLVFTVTLFCVAYPAAEAAQPGLPEETAESVSLPEVAEPWHHPLSRYDYLSAPFGESHTGLDYAVSEGTEVKAVRAGTVTQSAYDYRYGNYVLLDHGTDSDGNRWESLYACLRECAAAAGQSVETDSLLGFTGKTGMSTGPHLHFELRRNGEPIDPDQFAYYE